MKKVILLLCFIPFTLAGQVSFDFETGSTRGFVQARDNHWIADTSGALSGKYSLHHVFDSQESSADQAGTRVAGLDPSKGETKWSFILRHGTDPSASNCWAIFIMSDADPSQMYPGGEVNGFAAGVNLSGYDDTLRLWKVKNGSVTAVLSSGVNWQNDIGPLQYGLVNITRSAGGLWSLSVSPSGGSFTRKAETTDKDLFAIHWMGIFYKFTSTRDRLLWLDNVSVSGPFLPPIVPAVSRVLKTGDSSLQVNFNKDVAFLSSNPNNFALEPDGQEGGSVMVEDPGTFVINFNGPVPERTGCSLRVTTLCDADSICSSNVVFGFTPALASPGDIVLTEIMADPSPPVSLPDREYLEITNATGFGFMLKGWKLIADDVEYKIPGTAINPRQVLVLCRMADTSLFSCYGTTEGMPGFPVLNDAGKKLVLADGKGRMIHAVRYTDKWYGDKLKSEGGWSLEMIDINFPFYAEGNWTSSVSLTGGTPGKTNSVSRNNADPGFRGIMNVFPSDSQTISADFSEPLLFYKSPESTVFIDGIRCASVMQGDIFGNQLIIKTTQPLRSGKIYRLSVNNDITDYAGNIAIRKSFLFGLPREGSEGDLEFNELLFNPLPGDADYIELYNCSGKVLDASRFLIVSVNDEMSDTTTSVFLCDTSRCIIPGEYYAVTGMKERVLASYFSASDTNLFEVSRMPSMADENGHLVLLSRSHLKVDEVRYSGKMHSTVLSGTEGVALEKIRPRFNSMDANSWHSATETSGWGTPGRVNSVYNEVTPSADDIRFSSTRISPDNDGFEDFLVIDFKLSGLTSVITVRVFDETGDPVRTVVHDIYSGSSASVTWDGTDDTGTIVQQGLYILLITMYDETGKTSVRKRVCAVVRR